MTPVPVTLVANTPGELLKRYYPNGRVGGLVVDGVCPAAVGDAIELTVNVKKARRQFVVHGQLAWTRRKGSASLVQSFGVDFAPEDLGVPRLLAFARHEVDAESLRHEPRHAVELPVRLVADGIARRELLADVSYGGAFIRTWNPIDPGKVVELSMRLPRTLWPIRLSGRVAWVRRASQDSGMGLTFVDLDGSLQRALMKLFQHLRLLSPAQ